MKFRLYNQKLDDLNIKKKPLEYLRDLGFILIDAEYIGMSDVWIIETSNIIDNIPDFIKEQEIK